jgi:hypothetical protein
MEALMKPLKGHRDVTPFSTSEVATLLQQSATFCPPAAKQDQSQDMRVGLGTLKQIGTP